MPREAHSPTVLDRRLISQPKSDSKLLDDARPLEACASLVDETMAAGAPSALSRATSRAQYALVSRSKDLCRRTRSTWRALSGGGRRCCGDGAVPQPLHGPLASAERRQRLAQPRRGDVPPVVDGDVRQARVLTWWKAVEADRTLMERRGRAVEGSWKAVEWR